MECVKSKIDSMGMDNLDRESIDELKAWTCIAKDVAEYDYYYHITEAMEKPENVYGETYDENGRYYTQPRNSLGQFRMRRGYEPEMMMYRDMDYPMGKMYYSDGNMSQGGRYSESRYDVARRGYEESKAANPSMDNMSGMEKIFDAFEEDVKELKPKMTTNERTVAKNKLINMANMIM